MALRAVPDRFSVERSNSGTPIFQIADFFEPEDSMSHLDQLDHEMPDSTGNPENPEIVAARLENQALRAQLQQLLGNQNPKPPLTDATFVGPSTVLSPADKARRNAEQMALVEPILQQFRQQMEDYKATLDQVVIAAMANKVSNATLPKFVAQIP